MGSNGIDRPHLRGRKGTPQRKLAECIFSTEVIRTVDNAVDKWWKQTFRVLRTPFGDLRNMWRRHHCRTLNPYGDSENCPFQPKECAAAFGEAVRITCQARPRVPVGYFIRVAKSTAALRADEAVERKATAARLRRTSVQPEPPFSDDA